MFRARRAARVTRPNFDSTRSSSPSIGGVIIVSCERSMGDVDPFLEVEGPGSEPSGGRGSLSGRRAGPIDDPQQLVDRLVEVVVDQHVIGELETHRLLALRLAQSIGDLVLTIATLA